MRIDVVSIFPEYLAALDLSLIGKARQDGVLDVRVHDLRSFTTDRHRTVDDTPYGGGAGMVMKAEPWALALEAVLADASPAGAADAAGGAPAAHDGTADAPPGDGPATVGSTDSASSAGTPSARRRPTLVVPSPAGAVFDQAMAYEFAELDHLVFACGRYEGIDERAIDWARGPFDVRPVSLGDYVLNGGEVAVLAMVEAVGRLIPGVVGNPESLLEESHADGLLEYPVYTKPSSWRGRDIPEVLLSGNHARIAQWRRLEQFHRTADRRPDLLAAVDTATLTKADLTALRAAGFDVVDGMLTRPPH